MRPAHYTLTHTNIMTKSEMSLPMVPNEGKGEIIIYNPDDSIQLEVRWIKETVWLDRNQMSILFSRDTKTISKHINNALEEELKGVPTVANFAIVQKEGKRYVNRTKELQTKSPLSFKPSAVWGLGRSGLNPLSCLTGTRPQII